MEIFGPAFLIGAGSTTMLVTSLSMVADIIGENTVSIIVIVINLIVIDKTPYKMLDKLKNN